MIFVYFAAVIFNCEQQPALNIEIVGIDQMQGSIMVAVYRSQETFLSDDVVVGDSFEVTDKTVNAKVNLPYGKYAISIFHDLNSDGELNTNMFGIPKEPIGFSNDARGTFGPPNFEKAAFDFSQDHQKLSITLTKPGL